MMLENLDILDFRGFHRLRIPRLGRVNLLVESSMIAPIDKLVSTASMTSTLI